MSAIETTNEGVRGPRGPERHGEARYAPSDRAEVLAFRRRLGAPETACEPDHLRWRFEEHPRGNQGLWLWRDGGRLVAQKGAQSIELKVGDTEHRAAWTVERLCDPRATLAANDFAQHRVSDAPVSLEVVRAALVHGLVAQGYIDLGPVPTWVRVLDAAQVLGERFHARWASLLGHAVDLPLNAADACIAVSSQRKSFVMEELDGFDARFDALWSRLAPHYPVMARRDAAELSWRYGCFPERTRYRLFGFFDGHELAGYAVLHLQLGRQPRGRIVDFFCSPERSWWLMARCLSFFRRARVAAVECRHISVSGVRAMKQLGFTRRAGTEHLVVRAPGLGVDALARLCMPSAWFLTAGDGDLELDLGRSSNSEAVS